MDPPLNLRGGGGGGLEYLLRTLKIVNCIACLFRRVHRTSPKLFLWKIPPPPTTFYSGDRVYRTVWRGLWQSLLVFIASHNLFQIFCTGVLFVTESNWNWVPDLPGSDLAPRRCGWPIRQMHTVLGLITIMFVALLSSDHQGFRRYKSCIIIIITTAHKSSPLRASTTGPANVI